MSELIPKLTIKTSKMNKFLIYTSNLPMMPRNMEEVISFAKETPKFFIAGVELNPHLANVKAGDRILTKKGNTIYVIKALQESLDNLSEEDREYLDDLTRGYGLKKVNITSVQQITRFEDWCKSARPLIKASTNNKTNKMEKSKNSVKGMLGKLEEMFMPTRVDDVRLVMTTGEICVKTSNGYVAIDAQNRLNSYPEALTVDFPVYVISKPKDQLVPNDIIATDRGYAKVTKVEGDKINAISYTGACRKIRTINDVLFNQSMVKVVVSLSGNMNGQINPLMLALLNKEEGKSFDSLPILMMSQQGGTVGMNPMMAMMLAKGEGEDSFKDILMMSALSGNNLLGNMFGAFGNTPAPGTPVANQPQETTPEDDAE